LDGVDSSGGTAFHSTAEKGYYKILKLLLDREAATETATIRDRYRRTVLYLASAQGYYNTVSLLLERGSKMDERDSSLRTALHLAAQYDHTGTVEVLLDHSPNTTAKDCQGHIAWQLAVACKHEDVVRLLESLPGSNNYANINSLVLFQPPASKTDITGRFIMIRPSAALTEAWLK
jgi:ankyrin repeat protein